jgi:hypothetical protein
MRVLVQIIIVLSVPMIVVNLLWELLPKVSPGLAHTMAQNAPYVVAAGFYGLMVWGLGYWMSCREINNKGFWNG